jgi:8-oxo-dGTP diphosphatase
MSMHTQWNLRVYFLLLDPTREKILISKEIIGERTYYKLPGGGVEFGEGIAEAAMREAQEELGIDIQLDQPFYFTDYYLPSLFKKADQVVAFYYLVTTNQIAELAAHSEFTAKDAPNHLFEWITLKALPLDAFELASDQIVLTKLLLSKGSA